MSSTVPKTREAWLEALQELPSTPERIPAFFFSHGSPLLATSESELEHHPLRSHGPNGALGSFLKDFGPALLEKYKPKAIVVFSAHWETGSVRVVTDYGDENPLFFDFYNHSPELYRLKFKSRGNAMLSRRIVRLFREAGFEARTTPKEQPRGEDGRGGFRSGLDHGVFIPFTLMFGAGLDIPVVQVSIDSSLDPERHWAIGNALSALRDQGILVLSGGLTIHNLWDRSCFLEDRAGRELHAFENAIIDAVQVKNPEERKQAMVKLVEHHGFSSAHPRADHFVPLYVAAGAGGSGAAKVLASPWGEHTYAFGL